MSVTLSPIRVSSEHDSEYHPKCCSTYGGSKWSGLLIAISLTPLLRAKKAILLLLLIVLSIEDSRVVVR